mgnify:CR=1 FL=1
MAPYLIFEFDIEILPGQLHHTLGQGREFCIVAHRAGQVALTSAVAEPTTPSSAERTSNWQRITQRKFAEAGLKTPPAAVLIRKAIGIEKGSGTPNTAKVGKITRAQLEEIAKTKTPDLTAADLDAAVRTIAGSARSMGVDVEGV